MDRFEDVIATKNPKLERFGVRLPGWVAKCVVGRSATVM